MSEARIKEDPSSARIFGSGDDASAAVLRGEMRHPQACVNFLCNLSVFGVAFFKTGS